MAICPTLFYYKMPKGLWQKKQKNMIIFLVYFSLCILVAATIGEKRQIGQSWTFFFSLTFSILVALLLAYLSPLKGAKSEKNKSSNSTLFWIYIILGLLLCIGFIFMLPNPEFTNEKMIPMIVLSIGFFGASIYVKNPDILDEN